MPANLVKSAADEKHWREAKASAAAQGHKGDWKYITGTFERMKHHLGGTKGKRPWRHEEIESALDAIAEGADPGAVVEELIEGHWPAVPTWKVVKKPPKPKKDEPVTEGLESHVMDALQRRAPHLKAGVHYHFSDGLNAASDDYGREIADTLNRTGEFARAHYDAQSRKVHFGGSAYGRPRRVSPTLPCGGCGHPNCGYCA